MLFVDFLFLPFLGVVFGVHWWLRSMRLRKYWLLLASYAFYGCWDWRFLSLILFSTLVDYGVALRLSVSSRRRAWLLVSLVTNLGLLGFFKYCNFFIESAGALLQTLGLGVSLSTLEILLPVGISFYTFQTLSYSIDVYRRRLEPTRDLLDLALFVSFFPQLVAGPIIRAVDFLPQLKRPVCFARTDLRAALVLFFVGYVKKACISDGLAPYADQYFADPGNYDVLSSWVASIVYAIQIYCDFSGYSDMAIASAALLGYELCINFEHPYFATDITAFWRRWHISLSTWLRDYLYIPLGGNRGSSWFTCRNLLLTMLLGGLWHGAGWNFIIWGGLHGLALIVHRAWCTRPAAWLRWRGPLGLLGMPLTFLFVCFCWIFFRAESLSDALTICRAACLFESSGSLSLVGASRAPMLGLLGLLVLLHALSYRRGENPFWRRVPSWAFALGAALAVALVLPFVQLNPSPFIYFQF